MVAKVNFPVSEVLTGVEIVKKQTGTGHLVRLDEARLSFENTVVILRPIAETDEVEITHSPYTFVSNENQTPEWLHPFLGQTLQTVWVCENLQNYQDMVVFAFEFLHPTLAFVAECSVLRVFRLAQIRQ